MPKVYRVRLTEVQRKELKGRIRDGTTKPRTRERLELLRLSDAGLSIPTIAPILQQSESRVRYWVKRFLEQSTFEALEDHPPVGRPSSLTPERRAALRQALETGERTWTTGQWAAWLTQEYGLSLSDDQIGRKLKQFGIVWKRTSRGLKHKQKPEELAAKQAELADLKKKGARA